MTRCFEFYHLRSAWDGTSDPATIAIPQHRGDGSIKVTEDTGIVFVLLPGGTMELGAQATDKDAPFYDAQWQRDETLHEVTLSPFLLARHELTQGQWARLWNGDRHLRYPSYYKAGETIPVAGERITLTNPVESVDWSMCDTMLWQHGLVLPTEAQWEYGCRGTTDTPWLCDPKELKDYANIADATAKNVVPGWTCETWTDGHVVHSPVGSFAANAFGLFDVAGNVIEWCRDWYGTYGSERPGDGLRSGGGSTRGNRGGSYNSPAFHERSAYRRFDPPTVRSSGLGLRPARLIGR